MRTPLRFVPSLEAIKYEAPEDQKFGVTSLVSSGLHGDVFDRVMVSTSNGELCIKVEGGRVMVELADGFKGRIAVANGSGNRSLEILTLPVLTSEETNK